MKALKHKQIDFFIIPNSMEFFKRFSIDISFMKLDVQNWEQDENYLDGLNIIKNS